MVRGRRDPGIAEGSSQIIVQVNSCQNASKLITDVFLKTAEGRHEANCLSKSRFLVWQVWQVWQVTNGSVSKENQRIII